MNSQGWWLAPLGAQRPLEAYGPRGMKSMTDHILAAYAEDVTIRVAAEGGPGRRLEPPVVDVHEIGAAGVVYADSLVKVTAFAVPHGTWKHAYGYRFDTPDRSVVISGDTGPTDAVAKACNGCDVELFVPVGVTGPAVDQIEAAKAVCNRCPVQPECLDFALVTNQECGVWGGASEEERRRLRRSWLAQRRRRLQAAVDAQTSL